MAKLKVGQSGETENGVRYRLLADGPGSEVVGLSGIGARGDDPDVWGELTDALERRFIGVDLRAAMGRMATRRRGAASSMYLASFLNTSSWQKTVLVRWLSWACCHDQIQMQSLCRGVLRWLRI